MTDEEHGEAFKMGESFGFDAGYEAGQAAATPSATPADINMLWTVIDELKARIDALENPQGRVSPSSSYKPGAWAMLQDMKRDFPELFRADDQ